MGLANSCCQKTHHLSEESSPPYTDNVTAIPLEIKQEPPAFPRYPILPAIQSGKGDDILTGNGHAKTESKSSITKSAKDMFNYYKDISCNEITADGIEKLCNDLDLSPEDFKVLVLAYSIGAEMMCRFTEEEFVGGCEKLEIYDIESMKSCIPALLTTVEGPNFGPFYRWSYTFALDQDNGQRTLPLEIALSLWQLVFYQNKPVILDRWLDYLQNHPTIKGISKDTWDMFLIFVEQIGDNLNSYDDTEAWPSLLDDFVEAELENKLTSTATDNE